jgi:hypothetical protein
MRVRKTARHSRDANVDTLCAWKGEGTKSKSCDLTLASGDRHYSRRNPTKHRLLPAHTSVFQ